MLSIEKLRECALNSDNVMLTQHCSMRLLERNISYQAVISAIQTGEIIEQYPADFPHPSCLILGVTIQKQNLHVVCGTDGTYIWIITAYYPSQEKWESDFRTRRNA